MVQETTDKMLKKTHKKKKKIQMRGRGMGTHGGGARKKRKKSGHRGGSGMAGTGKRSDHKKTLITKIYGNKYFGKQGITSRKTRKDKSKKINIKNIMENINSYKDDKGIVNLPGYKILGKGEIKEKITIMAETASKSAIDKVKKSGGEIILSKNSYSKSKIVDKNKIDADKKEG